MNLLKIFILIILLQFIKCTNRVKTNNIKNGDKIESLKRIKMDDFFRDFGEHDKIYDSLEIEIGSGFFNDSIELFINNKLITKLKCSNNYSISYSDCIETLSDGTKIVISTKKIDKSNFNQNDTLKINYQNKVFYTNLRKDYNILVIDKLDSIRWQSIYFKGVDKSKHIKE